MAATCFVIVTPSSFAATESCALCHPAVTPTQQLILLAPPNLSIFFNLYFKQSVSNSPRHPPNPRTLVCSLSAAVTVSFEFDRSD